MAKENIIYGIRPVIEAIKAGKEIDKVMLQTGLRADHLFELMTLLRERELPFQQVPIQKLNNVTRANHQGVIAHISPVIYENIETFLPGVFEDGKMPLLLILDKVTDVRNFGALVRTAECAGIQAVIVPSRGSAQINEDAVKTSAGALFRVPVCRSNNLKDTIVFLRDSGLQIVAITEKCDHTYYEIDLTVPTAFILGSEEDGISEAYMKLTDQKVKIPMMGEIESLNVSVAGAVVMFEAVKQRMVPSK